MNMKVPAVLIALAALAPAAAAQLENFMVADLQGILYEVDGDTLQATQVVELEYGNSISEILYLGNNEIMASTIGGFIRYNLSTGVETIEFVSGDFAPSTSIAWIESAGFTAQRNMYFGVSEHYLGGDSRYGMLYNPHTGAFTRLADHEEPPSHLYFDYIEVGNHIFLATDGLGRTIRTFDAETGEIHSEFDLPMQIHTFLMLGDDVYAIDGSSQLYTYDLETGSAELYGTITGLQHNIIGATSMTVPQTSDINYDGARDFFDMTDFLNDFESREPIADWNDDGQWDFFDISKFMTDFGE
ncbi:MAG: hypothetical protein ACSHX5_10345 [Phycisphaerales bacterium]